MEKDGKGRGALRSCGAKRSSTITRCALEIRDELGVEFQTQVSFLGPLGEAASKWPACRSTSKSDRNRFRSTG